MTERDHFPDDESPSPIDGLTTGQLRQLLYQLYGHDLDITYGENTTRRVVLLMATEGFSQAEIARRLGISNQAISYHIRFANRGGVLARARMFGIMSDE